MSDGSSPWFSVVICAYSLERQAMLVAAIESVQRQTRPPDEILVVIDHNPALLDALDGIDGVQLIENRQARGLSGARNTGVAASTGDIIAFLDDDAIAAPDWIATLVDAFDDPRVMAAGGSVVPLWEQGRPAWFPDEFDWVVGCTYRGMPETTRPIRNVIGCNMAFRRGVFDAVGGFRIGMGRIGTVPLGCEETDLCIRALQQLPGGVVLFVPAASVNHWVPAYRSAWTYFRARCLAEGRSKAQLTRGVGESDGLAAERAYTLRTLPAGVVRGLAGPAHGQGISGVLRASTIVAGLAMTAAGYLAGKYTGYRARRGVPTLVPSLADDR